MLRKAVGVEIQEKMANMAKKSVEYNGLSEQINIVNMNIIIPMERFVKRFFIHFF